ncbi:zinc ABC transporter substrate-binding protein [[Clostridium] innocuum]|uniref:metal ABC transporter substrate-binding protein n=1 Tax=Bacillota TaxID=1239 RepID=UPI001C391770|nr:MULTISPECIES: zinc ABC transporter substrate-binding protein [Thomasclavelia]MBV4342159.1 zinc ABC transporter substrate-binding protein [Erysipelatoclostridium sp. DFI.2.3]MCC2790838.1 zinc ABC transporter substrate-binding protein [[Clostridium] innocuum]MCC2798948.1 zinc ABC transporter substrate-binding protein [[Clostridium] innocuum]MCC2805308.1 zinc ABC transporter substrate-binding protein [[Clostridium] innocuum]MCC2809320.1 zinc ABC transporter substrate-binding protein [[Clostrid
MKIKLFLVSVLALFLVSGCEEKNPSIATTVYPVQYLVERIGGDDVTVSNITENTMIQRAQIKSSFQDILKDSDALFYIGGLEPYMDLYVDDIRDTGVDMVDLATKSAIYKFERYTSTTIDGITAGTEGPYYEGEEFANLDTYDADPMLWMDPVAMTSMASDIRDYLVQKYPQYKDIFDENYDALELDLARLEADFQAIPDGKMNISFVSMTPSFGNWQKSYGIKVYPITLSKYGALPTSDQLAAMKKRIKSDHVRYIAIEQNLSEDMEKLQHQLIDELALIPVNLNNLSSISSEDKKASKDYLTIMYDNLKALESIAS